MAFSSVAAAAAAQSRPLLPLLLLLLLPRGDSCCCCIATRCARLRRVSCSPLVEIAKKKKSATQPSAQQSRPRSPLSPPPHHRRRRRSCGSACRGRAAARAGAGLEGRGQWGGAFEGPGWRPGRLCDCCAPAPPSPPAGEGPSSARLPPTLGGSANAPGNAARLLETRGGEEGSEGRGRMQRSEKLG